MHLVITVILGGNRQERNPGQVAATLANREWTNGNRGAQTTNRRARGSGGSSLLDVSSPSSLATCLAGPPRRATHAVEGRGARRRDCGDPSCRSVATQEATTKRFDRAPVLLLAPVRGEGSGVCICLTISSGMRNTYLEFTTNTRGEITRSRSRCGGNSGAKLAKHYLLV
jgi:hypothetical protein